MTPRSVKLRQGVWCDGIPGPDHSHTGGHVLPQGTPYVIWGGGEVACLEHARLRGLDVEMPEPAPRRKPS